MKTVRMLHDHPPGAEGADVVFREGAIREVDDERGAQLVLVGQAEELPDGWTPAADARKAIPKTKPAAGRKGA